jgi:ketosteroid isomerase-like protein
VSADPELLALVRRGFECWNTGELDLMQDMYAADAEVDFSAAFPDTAVIRGEHDMRRFQRFACLYTIDDGLVVRNELFLDTDAALAAAKAAA